MKISAARDARTDRGTHDETLEENLARILEEETLDKILEETLAKTLEEDSEIEVQIAMKSALRTVCWPR